jgi:hypothetical protein
MTADTGIRDEFESDMTRWPRDPKFRRAYEQACRRMWMSITVPLCIDGHEYHRRQRARRRGKR